MRSSTAASSAFSLQRGDRDCAISGAVGTFANIDPRVEEHVAAALG